MYKGKSIVVLFCLIVISGEIFSQKIVESMPLKMKSYASIFGGDDGIVTTHLEDTINRTVELLIMARKNWHLLKYDKNFKLLSNRKISCESHPGEFIGAVKIQEDIFVYHKLYTQISYTRISTKSDDYSNGTLVGAVYPRSKEIGYFKKNNKVYYIRVSKSKSSFKVYELSDKSKEYEIKFDKKKAKLLFKGFNIFSHKQTDNINTKNPDMPADIIFASGDKKIYPTDEGFDLVVDYKNEINVLSVNLRKKEVSQNKVKVDDFKHLKGSYSTKSYMFGDHIYYITSGKIMFTVGRVNIDGTGIKDVFTIYRKFVPDYKYLNFIQSAATSANARRFGDNSKKVISHKKFAKKINAGMFGVYVEDYDDIHLMVHIGALQYNNSSELNHYMMHRNQMHMMDRLNKLNKFNPPPAPTFRGPCPLFEIYPEKENRFDGITKGEQENDTFYTRFLVTKSDLKYKTSKGIKPSIYARYNSLVKSLKKSVYRGEYVKLNYLFKFDNKYYMSFYSKLDGKRCFNIMEVKE